MRTQSIVIIGITGTLLAALAAALWIVSAALKLADPPLWLSVFEPHAGGCAWYRMSVGGREEDEIARFAVDCPKVQVAWNLQADAALVWFADEALESRDELLFLVDIKRHKSQRLVAAEPGEPVNYMFDDDGRVIAFTENQQINVLNPPGGDSAAATPPTELEFQGGRYKTSLFPEGQHILVHALLLEDGAWRPLETKGSRCCADGAPGVHALDLYEKLARDPVARRQSARLLTNSAEFRPVAADSPLASHLKERLKPADQQSDAAWWSLLQPGWPRGLVFRGSRGDEPHATGLAFFTDGDKLKRIPGFDFRPNDVVQLMAQDRYLLVTDWGSGMQPHLYDMQSGQLVFSSPVAHAVTFWPVGSSK